MNHGVARRDVGRVLRIEVTEDTDVLTHGVVLVLRSIPPAGVRAGVPGLLCSLDIHRVRHDQRFDLSGRGRLPTLL